MHAETGRQWSSQASPSGSSATDPRAAIEELVTAGFPERQANALVCSLGQLMKRGLSITAVIWPRDGPAQAVASPCNHKKRL